MQILLKSILFFMVSIIALARVNVVNYVCIDDNEYETVVAIICDNGMDVAAEITWEDGSITHTEKFSMEDKKFTYVNSQGKKRMMTDCRLDEY